MFDGRSVSYQRRTATPGTPRDVRVRRAIVSVSGGILPGILSEALSNPAYLNSGLAARLVFAMPPKQCVRWTDTEPDPDAGRRFRKAVHALRERPFDPQSAVPSVGMTAMARAAFTRFHDEMAATAEGYDGGGMATALPKLVRIGLRLAMIHHCATEADADRDPSKDSISETSMLAGVELAGWFETEAERVYAMLSEKPEDRAARTLAEWVKRKGGRVTPRDLQRSNGRKYPTTDAAEVALDALVTAGVGRWEELPPPKSGGWGGRVFVLGPTPSADGRHSPTHDTGTADMPADAPSDTRSDAERETPAFLRECERVSASVGCRTGIVEPTPPPESTTPPPEQVSDAPAADKVRRRANPNRGVGGKRRWPMTAQKLLDALTVAGCAPALDGLDVTFDRDPPPELDRDLDVLLTGVRALLLGKRWYGIDTATGRAAASRSNEVRTPAPPTVSRGSYGKPFRTLLSARRRQQ